MFDRERFKALVHYVCWKCDDPAKLGAVKLNKILWYSDTMNFVQRGSPITGARYVKQRLGPIPKAIVPLLKEMEEQGIIRVREVELYGKIKREFISLTEADSTFLSDEERSLVDQVIDVICNHHTAASISDQTHDAIWRIAATDEEMPMHSVLASSFGAITVADVSRAKERMAANAM